MRKFLTILFLLISLSGFSQTKWYISTADDSPAGNDGNSGTISSPWLTLAHACSQVSTPGDIIWVNDGTFIETVQSVLAVGVSIESNLAEIHSHITTTGVTTIALHSAEGTNGNQHISGLLMTGGTGSAPTAYSAIEVWGRSNVTIEYCQIFDFFSQGVTFMGTGSNTGTAPSTWATGNSFHDNIVRNCSEYRNPERGQYGDGQGCLMLGGQGGTGSSRMQIYNNTITQVDRADTYNGYPVKFACNGFNKGLHIYNNVITAKPFDNLTWDFSMELWHSLGGIEINGNQIQGDIDFGGCALSGGVCVESGGISISAQDVGSVYGFSAKIYNNILGQESMRIHEEVGITPERGITGGFYVYNNWFKNLSNALQMYQGNGDTFEDLYVYCNVFYNIGILGSSSGNTIDWGTIDGHTITYDDIYFDQNTIYAGTDGYAANSGLRFNFPGNCTDLYVRNNIIYGFDAYAIYFGGYPVAGGSITNNVFYANASNTIESGGASINLTIGTNYTTNPAFNNAPTDFHILISGSAYHAGTLLNYTSDYDGVEFNNPPSIGAFEYTGVSIYLPTVTTATITSIGTTSATGGGEVTNTGGSTVYSRGICWSLTLPPTIADSYYTSGSGLGSFISYLTGLTAGTTYYVRAYASNSIGTGYGSLVTFQTNPAGGVENPVGFIQHLEKFMKLTIDGRIYPIKICPEKEYNEYYVSNDGNDNNNGKSLLTAWKTIAKINASTFLPGDRIYFKRGDIWREQLIVPSSGSSSGYITFSAYGVGNKPKFLGSVTANSGWSDQGSNIWQNSNAAFTVDVGNLIFNNEASCGTKIMSATPTLDAQGEFWYDFVNDRIRMYSVSDPAIFYTNIECALKHDIINTNIKHYIKIENIDLRYGGACGIVGTGNHFRVTNCDLSYIGGSDINNNYATRYGNAIELDYIITDIIIEKCHVNQVYDAGVSNQYTGVNISQSYIWYQNNIIENCEYSYETFNRGVGSTIGNIHFEHNTCLNAGGGWGHFQRPDGVAGYHLRISGFYNFTDPLYIRNNIFYKATESVVTLFPLNLTEFAHYVFDYNDIYTTTGLIAMCYDDEWATLAAYQSGTRSGVPLNLDAHSISVDPLFVSSSDYQLQISSPCINTGIDVGITTDYLGHSRVGLPDIGAYEKQ